MREILIKCFGAIVVTTMIISSSVASSQPNNDYGVIIDAGSSGSRVFVYYWRHREDTTTLPDAFPLDTNGLSQTKPNPNSLVLNKIFITDALQVGSSAKADGGLANVPLEKIEEYLKPLIDHAKSLVPQKKHSQTPIFLFATAGMRMKTEEEQNATLTKVRSTLQNTGFRFDNPEKWACVISGEDEGAFGWVTTNYLKRILVQDNSEKLTVGALDLGGASLQITFLPEEAPKKEPYHLILPDKDYKLYTHSFLSYGQDEARKSLYEIAAEKAKTASGSIPQEIPFPCFLSGYKEQATLKIDGQEHTLVGTGNYDLCSEYEVTMLNLNAPCETSPCSIDGTYQPKYNGLFYAMSGFYYTADFFGFSSGEKATRASMFKSKGNEFCAMNWDNAVKQYPKVPEKNLKMYCFTASYIHNILTKGFGFGENEDRFYFTKEVYGSELNWALGGLIAQVPMLDNTNGGTLVQPHFILSLLSILFITIIPLFGSF